MKQINLNEINCWIISNRQIMHTLTKSKNITTAHLRFKWAVSVKV